MNNLGKKVIDMLGNVWEWCSTELLLRGLDATKSKEFETKSKVVFECASLLCKTLSPEF